MLMSIGDLIADMQREDPGVTASVCSQGESVRARPMTFSVQQVWVGKEQQHARIKHLLFLLIDRY